MLQIFLSHSTRDRSIARELQSLIHALFGPEKVSVEFSSDQSAGGGIPPGAAWLPWITEQIKLADRVYVLLTPGSLGRPWVIWESGAAAGVALGMGKDIPVVPVTFGIADENIPHPFHSAQRVKGDFDGEDGIDRILQDLNRSLGHPLTASALAATAREHKLPYFARIGEELGKSSSVGSLIASVRHSFPASKLAGPWVTAYEFRSSQGVGRHVDIAHLRAESDRRLISQNFPPPTPSLSGAP